jgi:very-short-patch-repair endonuclease
MTKDNDYLKYLVKTLSKTNRKDYENYVINAIFQRIGNLNLRPITQQFVRTNNKFYYLDLYFPQIKIGIEVNEDYHKKQIKKDNIRINDIYNSISEKDFKLFSVNIESFEETEKQVNLIVKTIKEALKKTKLISEDYNEKLNNFKKSRSFYLRDNFLFKRISDVALVFGKNYKAYQRASFTIESSKDIVWFPTLSYDFKGKKLGNSKWTNILSEKWDEIIESPKVSRSKKDIKKLENEFENSLIRVVFAKTRSSLGFNGYRFIGVFKLVEFSKKEAKYIRIYDKYSIRKIL